MDEKIFATPETAVVLKLDATEASTYTKNGNWRLKLAIDILLDYIIQFEEGKEDFELTNEGES